MNIKFLLLAISAVTFASCSTTYKSGQTPDDVYYSPVKVIEENDSRDEEEVRNERNDSYEDNEIRMASRDRRWRDTDDDYNCRYDPYRYGYNHGYYYNPYYYNKPVYIPGSAITNPKNTVARMTNLGSYNNTATVLSTSKTGTTTWITSQRPYNNSNSSKKEGFFRRVIEPVVTGATNRSSSDNNTRTYSPSSGNSSSGSSSGSKSSTVTRPGRQ